MELNYIWHAQCAFKTFFGMNILLVSHVACHVALILRFAKEDLKIYFWGKFHLVLGILARVIAIQSYFSHTPFVQA